MIMLKQLREAKGLNMREAARLLSLPYTTYVNYEKGQREPTSELLIHLADFFETSVDYLVGREGYTAHTISFLPPTPVFEIDSTEEEMIRKFRCLDDRGKSTVLNTLNHEFDSLPGKKTHSPAKEA